MVDIPRFSVIIIHAFEKCICGSAGIGRQAGLRLLILDEPTSGLDPVSRDELMELFRGVVKSGERSILFSTHITSDLEKCASHITMIKDGQILCSDTRDGFLARYRAQFGDGQMSLEDILVRVERRSYDSEDFL